MNVTTQERPHREVQLTIHLEAEDVERYLERAYRRAVRRLNVPGFRKGKAPRHIIEQRYGREYLLNEALEFMVPEVTDQAVAEAAIDAVGTPSINLEELDPPRFTATVPLTPTAELGEYLSVRVPQEPVEVNEEQVAQVLERLRVELAPWEPVDEPAAFNDLVNITVNGWAGEKEISNEKGVDYVLQEGAQRPMPGFSEALVGLAANQGHEFTLESPPGDGLPEQSPSYRFAVTIHEVKRKHPAALDDEFAKGVGEGHESLAALKEKLREDVVREQEELAASRRRREVLEAVVDKATVEMSPLLVEHEVEHRLQDHQEALRSGRMSLEQYQQYLEWAGKSSEEVREASWPQAESRLKYALVMREIAQRHQLEVVDQKVEAEIERLAANAGDNADTVRRMFSPEESRESLRRALLTRKTEEFLVRLASGEDPEAAASAVGTGMEPESVPGAVAATGATGTSEMGGS